MRPPVDFVVEGGTGCHLLEVGSVGVRRVDALLAGSWCSSRGEDECDLRAVGRPADIPESRDAADGDRDLHQAATVGMNDVDPAEPLTTGERDLGAVGRPTAVVVAEAPRRDPMEAAAADVDDVERRGLVAGTEWPEVT